MHLPILFVFDALNSMRFHKLAYAQVDSNPHTYIHTHTHTHTHTHVGGDYYGRENQKSLMAKKQADSNLHCADTERGHALDGIRKIIDVSHSLCIYVHVCTYLCICMYIYIYGMV
jgi:hypothetical protein